MNAISGADLLFNPPGEHNSGIRDLRTEALAEIIRERAGMRIQRLLVVGCGSGREAAVLGDVLRVEVIGIDLIEDFDGTAAAAVQLQRGDATSLDFPDASFDFVFSYHALEHIPEHTVALSEMSRVLRPGGGFCVGTPNRTRILAYFGSPGTSTREKIRWNLIDWKARIRGRFHNRYGAHAGFSSSELQEDLETAFGGGENITLAYYQRVYRNHAVLCSFLETSGLGKVFYPCVYFLGRKATRAGSTR